MLIVTIEYWPQGDLCGICSVCIAAMSDSIVTQYSLSLIVAEVH